MDIGSELEKMAAGDVKWKKITREGLDLDYSVVLPKKLADALLMELEETVEYYPDEVTKVSTVWYCQ